MSYHPLVEKNSHTHCRTFLARVLAVTTLALCLFSLSSPSARAQTTSGSTGLVISQIYTRGGEPGAAFQNDYVELFNRGNTTVNIAGLGLVIVSSDGNLTIAGTTAIFSLRGSASIAPGQHFLVALGGGGAGQPLPAADLDLSFTPLQLLGQRGQVALLRNTQNVQSGQCLANDTTDSVVDFVAYGDTTCFEGRSPVPAPTAAFAVTRQNGGCADTNDNEADFKFAAPAPHSSTDAATPCGASPPPSVFNFAAPQFDSAEGQGHATITVTRLGDTSTPASVDFSTDGMTASERSDFTTAWGTLRFAPGETEKTFDVLITDDAFVEPNETVFLGLLHATGASIGPRNSAVLVIHDNDFSPAPNPLDRADFYVRQHYNDFLSREPDSSGLQFWTNNITSCGTDAQCVEVKRVDTSAAFFLSIEFQNTGFLVHRLYRASLPETPARPRSMPRYHEFIHDTHDVGLGVVVGATGWEQKLEDNKRAFVEEFAARDEFVANYPASLTPAEYVDKLNAQAGNPLSPAERDTLVAEMIAGLETRATVLRKVAENSVFTEREFDRAFVLMQYFGYLRRNPDDAPDSNFDGYDFWLSKLDSNGGDFHKAEMVKAFISSDEYRNRFAAPAP